MKTFFKPNITSRGRVARGITALGLLLGGLYAWPSIRWLSVLLLVSAVFVAFEALRGWCVMRACGVRTPM